jgi:hypothetical protein
MHGKGWTEWEILKRAEPKFAGHHQPKKPLWGYGDEADSAVFAKKIEAAAHAGIDYFIFDWYWYERAPFLQRGLESGYLGAANKDKLKFCIMWANHDWLNLMPARLREQSSSLIYEGRYDSTEFARIADYVVTRYFSQPSYFKVNGAPYFSLYETKTLTDRLGGLDAARRAFDDLRKRTQAAGFPGLHFNAVAWGLKGFDNPGEVVRTLGIDSVTSYTWAHHCQMKQFPASEYADMVDQAEAYWLRAKDLFGVPYHTDVSMGWDASPRACQSDRFEQASYPFMSILRGNSPEAFESALHRAKKHVDAQPGREKFVTLNSWNEWTEGSFLEPELLHGSAYLDAVGRVFAR